MGAWAASFINVPHVWHIHEFGYEDHGLVYDLGDRFARWVYRKKGGYFIVNSVAVAKKYLNFLSEDFFQKKHKVIYQSVTLPPVDPLFSRPELRCETVLVLVGALHKNKGQADAISAICKLRNQGIKAGLVLVGEGEDRGYFEQMVSELDIQRYVHFIGSVENVSNWIALSDIALVCSKLEAFGRVAVEAMLCKKPVIAANTGGLNEIVRHGETGLQYEPGDIDGLVANIILLIDDKSMYKNFSEKAYAWVTENFNKDKYGKDLYETIADEVLKK
jgi:glycosyltransferase involved in cell wall biosynthesis